MNRRLLLAVCIAAVISWLSALSYALEPEERLADPALEARARALSAELRCLVCDNESIDQSRAPLAGDLRRLVRERLVAGDSDAEVKNLLVERYGAYVLLRPEWSPATWALWLVPAVVALLAAFLVYARRRRADPPEALTPEEQEQADRLLAEAAEAPGSPQSLNKI